MKGVFNSSVISVFIDTDRPPDPLAASDFVAATEVVLFVLANFIVMISVVVNRNKLGMRFVRPWAVYLMTFGGSVHVISLFISNGYLADLWFMNYLRIMWCPLWDFVVSFGLGYNPWFVALSGRIYTWISVLRAVLMPNTDSERSAHVVRPSVNSGIGGGGGGGVMRNNSTFDMHNFPSYSIWIGRRVKQRAMSVLFFVAIASPIYILCAVVIGVKATQYDPHTQWCVTTLTAKLLLLTWLAGTVAVMIILLMMVRRLRHIPLVLYDNTWMSIVVGVNMLLLLIIVNISGISVTWWGRFVDINLLMFMYGSSLALLMFNAYEDMEGENDSWKREMMNFVDKDYCAVDMNDILDGKNELLSKFLDYVRHRKNFYMDSRLCDASSGALSMSELRWDETDDPKESPVGVISTGSASFGAYVDYGTVLVGDELANLYVDIERYDNYLANNLRHDADMQYAHILCKYFPGDIIRTDECVTDDSGTRTPMFVRESMRDKEPAFFDKESINCAPVAMHHGSAQHAFFLNSEVMTAFYHNVGRYHLTTSGTESRLWQVKRMLEIIFETVYFPGFCSESIAYQQANHRKKQMDVLNILSSRGIVGSHSIDRREPPMDQQQAFHEIDDDDML